MSEDVRVKVLVEKLERLRALDVEAYERVVRLIDECLREAELEAAAADLRVLREHDPAAAEQFEEEVRDTVRRLSALAQGQGR